MLATHHSKLTTNKLITALFFKTLILKFSYRKFEEIWEKKCRFHQSWRVAIFRHFAKGGLSLKFNTNNPCLTWMPFSHHSKFHKLQTSKTQKEFQIFRKLDRNSGKIRLNFFEKWDLNEWMNRGFQKCNQKCNRFIVSWNNWKIRVSWIFKSAESI